MTACIRSQVRPDHSALPEIGPRPTGMPGGNRTTDKQCMKEKAKPVVLTQQELESRLLAAANSLRGPVDPADFKQYVFPLLFLKRLSDAWNAEHARAEADYAPSPVPESAWGDYHRFTLPPGCHWTDLRKLSENVGHGLQLILDRIQEANPATLAGIFGEVAWANKDRLPEHALLRLVDIFNGIPLDPSTVPHDMLGQAYEYLLREFAEASGKKAGEFFTPRAVVRLLTRLLDPQESESIYDPAAGSAGMLVEAVNEVREAGGDVRTLKLYGQEINLTTAAIARMNLIMHDFEDFRIVRGDTLREPKFQVGSGELTRFDVVIANPPFSLRNWGADVWTSDPYKRAFCGVPPAASADYAWIQHMLSSMRSQTGRVGVVMPMGALFRRGAEADIRSCLVMGDLLDAVIALPQNLFYSTTIPACLLIFRASKPESRRGGVQFIDATDCFVKAKVQNIVSEKHVNDILNTHHERGDGSVPSVFVTQSELRQNDWDLNITRYVQSVRQSGMTLSDALVEFQAAADAARLAEAHLLARLARLADV